MQIKTVQLIEEAEFSKRVSEIYQRPYRFQQQDGCRAKGNFWFTVPLATDEMGVSLASWLARDPKQCLVDLPDDTFALQLWWERIFYPDFQTVANQLWEMGELPAGQYLINIDW